MKANRITAFGLVAVAALWVASGYLLPHETGHGRAAGRPAENAAAQPFRVAVQVAEVVPHSRRLYLSGRTEAFHKVMATARTNGIVKELRVRRGQAVKTGDVLAVLSDEAREAQLAQASALYTQRTAELEARRKLIEQGTLPRLEGNNLETQQKSAAAALAAAEAELERGQVRAAWAGVVTDVPTEIGQALTVGKEVAQIVSLDPMLAVVEASERSLAGIAVGEPAEVRLVTGQTATGKIRYVAKTASAATRTYRVEVELKNADGAIPDGITAEVAVPLAPVPSTRVPRSALTFSSGGDLGVRIVKDDDTVGFVKVDIGEDEQGFMWVRGIAQGARVIIQGQDFVREGQKVQIVPLAANTASR